MAKSRPPNVIAVHENRNYPAEGAIPWEVDSFVPGIGKEGASEAMFLWKIAAESKKPCVPKCPAIGD